MTEISAVYVDSSHPEPWLVDRCILGRFTEHNGRDLYPAVFAQHVANPAFATWFTFPFQNGGAPSTTWYPVPPEPGPGVPTWFNRTEISHRGQRPHPGLAYPWQPAGRNAEFTHVDGGRRGGPEARFQRIELDGAGGISQLLPLPDRRTLEYIATVSLRTRGDLTALRLELRDHAGDVRATATVPDTSSWEAQTVRLTLPAATSDRYRDDAPFGNYELALLAEGTGTLEVDWLELMSADAINGRFDPTTIELLREHHVPTIRWPGGNFTSQYHWRDGVGPIEQRPVRRNLPWGGLEPNLVGTAEWLEFCQLTGIEPLLNIGYSPDITPAEAAEWVQYVNGDATTPMGRLRAEHGHPEPWGVRLWQVGNEVHGPWQVGHTDGGTFGTAFREFKTAMSAVDPSITVIAAASDPTNVDIAGPAWNEALLDAAGDAVSSVDIHEYTRGIVDSEQRAKWLADQGQDPVGYAEVLVAFPGQFEQLIEELRQSAEVRGVPDLLVNVGEWNLEPLVDEGWPRADYPTMAHACYVAGMYNVFIRQGRTVRWAYQRDNGLYWRAYPIDFRPLAPGATTLRLYSEPLSKTSWHYLPTEINGPRINLPQTGSRFRETADVPIVDVAALLSASRDEVVVFAVNRDLRSSQAVGFIVPNAAGDVEVELQAPVDDDPFRRQQSWSEQDAFALRHSTMTVDQHGRVQLQLPPGSIVRLRTRVSSRTS